MLEFLERAIRWDVGRIIKVELIRKTVWPTVADGEVRKELQVHLCVVREREDVEKEKSCRTRRRSGGMRWITESPPLVAPTL